MSVRITSECISCDACLSECPVEAILSEDANPVNDEYYYVKPENCVECVGHADMPRCAEVCPTEGAIVWDMPYTLAYNEYYLEGHEANKYKIRFNKKKETLMTPDQKEMPFKDEISIGLRSSGSFVSA